MHIIKKLILFTTSYTTIPIQNDQWKFQKTSKKYTTNSDLEIPKQKRVTFTYTGKEIAYITKIFKHSNLKIAYCTNISIQKNLNPKTDISNNAIFPNMILDTITKIGL
jgi:hypothetical protein